MKRIEEVRYVVLKAKFRRWLKFTVALAVACCFGLLVYWMMIQHAQSLSDVLVASGWIWFAHSVLMFVMFFFGTAFGCFCMLDLIYFGFLKPKKEK